MKIIIKELFISVLITIVMFILLSLVVCYTSVSENVIDYLVIAISCISLIIGGFKTAKQIKKNGIIYGGILGVIYILVLYILSGLICMNFSLSMSSIYMIILSILGGALGGILGVNFLK